jgi:hypothetical protein
VKRVTFATLKFLLVEEVCVIGHFPDLVAHLNVLGVVVPDC